jgi:hypothetical protein
MRPGIAEKLPISLGCFEMVYAPLFPKSSPCRALTWTNCRGRWPEINAVQSFTCMQSLALALQFTKDPCVDY